MWCLQENVSSMLSDVYEVIEIFAVMLEKMNKSLLKSLKLKTE